MKKTLYYSLSVLALFGLLTLQSCNDDDVLPVLNVSSSTEGYADGTFTAEVGDELTLNISVEAEEGFKSILVSKSTGDVLLSEEASEDKQESYSTTLTYTVVAEDVNAGNTITILVSDENDNTEEFVVTLSVEEAPVAAVKYSATLLTAPQGDNTSKTFFSTDDGSTYSRNDVETTADPVSPKIDFGYYFGSTNKASLASPDSYPSTIYDLSAWGTKNATKLKLTEMPAEHFTSIVSNADILTHYGMTDMSDADGDVISLAVGQTIAFELDAAKGSLKGFIYVKSIVEGTGSDGKIEIEVVMETAE